MPKELVLDYGDFILSRDRKTVPEAVDLLGKMIRDHTLSVANIGDVKVSGNLNEGGLPVVPSGRNWGYVRPSWPAAYYYFQTESNVAGNIPQHDLVKLGLPLYPDGESAVAAFCDLQHKAGLDRRMIILIPDFRARIRELRIQDRMVSLNVEVLELSEKNLRAKFYCATEDSQVHSEDLPVKEGKSVFSIQKPPLGVIAHVLSTEGDDIDSRDFYLYKSTMEPDVVVEASKPRVEELARRGEGLHVEYKESLPQRESELLESITAFANTAGGAILLGVSNNGDIVGIKGEPTTIEETVNNWIGQKCDPRIEVNISRVDLDGKTVLVIDIPPGKDRPYLLQDRGIFIRTGSTDRHVRRSELDQLYQRLGE